VSRGLERSSSRLISFRRDVHAAALVLLLRMTTTDVLAGGHMCLCYHQCGVSIRLYGSRSQHSTDTHTHTHTEKDEKLSLAIRNNKLVMTENHHRQTDRQIDVELGRLHSDRRAGC